VWERFGIPSPVGVVPAELLSAARAALGWPRFFEKDKDVESQKMAGTEDDVKALRPTATELAAAAIKACP
jgi:hypothetical protein